MARQQRDLKRERTWRRHLEQHRVSGLTIRAFCAESSLRETSFYFWRQELAKRDRESSAQPNPAPAFVPVAVIDPPAERTESPIDIRLVEGHRVRIRSGCDRGPLALVRDFRATTDASANVIDQSYYRYSGNSAATGSVGLMNFAFGPEALARLATALGTSVDSLSDSAIAPSVDKHLAYDSSGRIATAVDAAVGCSACSGGLGSFTAR